MANHFRSLEAKAIRLAAFLNPSLIGKVILRVRSCAHPDVHPGRTCGFQDFADFISCCAGSEDIIDKRNMLAIKTVLAIKSLDQIFVAFSCVQCGLPVRVSDLLQK